MKTKELIGDHPSLAPFGMWFKSEDLPETDSKKHRALEEDESLRWTYIKWMSSRLIDYHCSPRRLQRLRNKYESLNKLKFNQYAEQQKILPTFDLTKKGNFCEVLLSEYIISCNTSSHIIQSFKLRYNPNVEQSMKGDDVLLIDIKDVENPRIYLGETKFRKKTNSNAIREIMHSLKPNSLPTSIPFLIENLENNNYEPELEDILDNLLLKEIKRKGDLIHIGLILGSENSQSIVEKHYSTKNKYAVIVSVGTKYPEDLIFQAYNFAKMIIKKGKYHEPR